MQAGKAEAGARGRQGVWYMRPRVLGTAGVAKEGCQESRREGPVLAKMISSRWESDKSAGCVKGGCGRGMQIQMRAL